MGARHILPLGRLPVAIPSLDRLLAETRSPGQSLAGILSLGRLLVEILHSSPGRSLVEIPSPGRLPVEILSLDRLLAEIRSPGQSLAGTPSGRKYSLGSAPKIVGIENSAVCSLAGTAV